MTTIRGVVAHDYGSGLPSASIEVSRDALVIEGALGRRWTLTRASIRHLERRILHRTLGRRSCLVVVFEPSGAESVRRFIPWRWGPLEEALAEAGWDVRRAGPLVVASRFQLGNGTMGFAAVGSRVAQHDWWLAAPLFAVAAASAWRWHRLGRPAPA